MFTQDFKASDIMKKQNTVFTLYSLCALCSLWLKISQSKKTNYSKKTQFPKKSNIYNRNFNNELQRKTDNGHLVKTNPNKANL